MSVREVIAECFRPAHFFAGPDGSLIFRCLPREERPWEIHRGRLLDPKFTRAVAVFESWQLYKGGEQTENDEPLLAVRLDPVREQLQVTRGIHVYAWEGYDAGENVILSRETRKWVAELVATIELSRFSSVEELRDELVCVVFQAVVGVSRLPLTSVEAPHPLFSLGQLAYSYRPDRAREKPMDSVRGLLAEAFGPHLAWVEKVKLVEAALRAAAIGTIPQCAHAFVTAWSSAGESTSRLPHLFRDLFNEVALSPYGDFVDKALAFWRTLAADGVISAESYVDTLGVLLRQTCRHLTAYDLITFHHRGANYPDALFLDRLLEEYTAAIHNHPRLFESTDRPARQRRRAVRQGWLVRRYYEGLPVPAEPTSPGENARVLPGAHERIPEEEILIPAKRTRRLFDGRPLELDDAAEQVLRLSLDDLQDPDELGELGTALYLDRPLGAGRPSNEPDQTPLFSYVLFSPSRARDRLQWLGRQRPDVLGPERLHTLEQELEKLADRGTALRLDERAIRSVTVSLHDAARIASDFRLVRMTARTRTDFAAAFDLEDVRKRFGVDVLSPGSDWVVVRSDALDRTPPGRLLMLDGCGRRRLELAVDPDGDFARRAGVEFPAGGLRVVRVFDPETGKDVACDDCALPPLV